MCVMGAGYVGLVTSVCFAELGNQVICMDRDKDKIEALSRGIPPFYEPGLEELLYKNLSAGRIRFTADAKEGVQACDIIFICVGTPQLHDGKADLSQVEDASRAIGQYAASDKIVVEKSTVPVNTGIRVRELLEQSRTDESIHFSVVSNPEFLRQGAAINDFFHPDRVVLGFEAGESQKDRVLSLYEAIDAPKIATDIASAELIKHASNTFLALKISFINLISRLCEETQADVKEVAWGIGLDKRIGYSFLEAGIGYGGSCFPKDIRAFQKILEEKGIHSALLQAIEDINASQKELFAERIKASLGEVRGKTIAVLGLSFKPNTDDMREAPSISILGKLQQGGAGRIKAYDPQAMNNAKRIFMDGIEYSQTPYEAAKDADALVILTEWNEFKDLDLEKIRALLRRPVVIDGRNIFDPSRMRELGFTYIGIGRAQ
ncbi:MAG: UDP-glucose/GDP-mannose dehydrogenase family protein [bacterium]|nr:UDP-glucose/GDP-mannose dehydrogenase family protein [bacterium]